MARRKGNSVFVDEDFNAYADQWELLSQIRKLSEVELDMLLRLHTVPTLGELSTTSEEKPWETPKMDKLKTLVTLYLTFCKVGVMTFGGGLAMMPMLQKELIEKRGWITDEDLIDYYAIGQSTPGIVAVKG